LASSTEAVVNAMVDASTEVTTTRDPTGARPRPTRELTRTATNIANDRVAAKSAITRCPSKKDGVIRVLVCHQNLIGAPNND
jgi:hypothetical protein